MYLLNSSESWTPAKYKIPNRLFPDYFYHHHHLPEYEDYNNFIPAAGEKDEGSCSNESVSYLVESEAREFEGDDAAWIMACVFIIFTMQTGILFIIIIIIWIIINI